MKNLTLFFITALVLISCSNRKDLCSITLYDENKADDFVQIPLDSIAKSVEIIQLDSTDGYITDLIETNDYYFVVWRSEQISQYNKDGEFICNIYGVGRGPGEYVAVSGLYYNEIDSTLFTFDFAQQKLIKYKNGKYIVSGSVPLNENDVFFSSFYPCDCNLIFYALSKENNPFIVQYNINDAKCEPITKKGEAISDDVHSDDAHFFYNGNPIFYSTLNDTVFSIVNNKLRADFLIKNFSTPTALQNSIICIRALGDNIFIHYNHINQDNKRTRYIGLYNQTTGVYNQNCEITSLNPQEAIVPTSKLVYSDGTILIKADYVENNVYLVRYYN